MRVSCSHGKVWIHTNESSLHEPEYLDFTSAEYCGSGTSSLPCKNPYGNGYSEFVFVAVPSRAAKALSALQYASWVPRIVDTCVIEVYDGAGDLYMPLAKLNSRRDGSHVSDKSGATSSYLRPVDLQNGAKGNLQCYVSSTSFSVRVNGYQTRNGMDFSETCTATICLKIRLEVDWTTSFLVLIICFNLLLRFVDNQILSWIGGYCARLLMLASTTRPSFARKAIIEPH